MIYTPDNWPHGRYFNFSHAEMKCQHCGACDLAPSMMDNLQQLRIAYGRPMKITSGYRCPDHPIEAAKPQPGSHATGQAVDIGCDGAQGIHLFALLGDEWMGVGVSQRPGKARFIHLDTIEDHETHLTRPMLWSY